MLLIYKALFRFSGVLLLFLFIKLNSADAQVATTDIRLNQVGFLPAYPKVAVVKTASATTFQVKSADLSQTVYSGTLGQAKTWAASKETVKVADFSEFKIPGNYVITVDGIGQSFPFKISQYVLNDVSKGVIKAFYYQRASNPVLEQYGGKYARPLGHPDTHVVVLPSAASAGRPAGTVISTPRGWYDAGDYNKYIVNSGISTFTLLSAYEHFTSYFDTLHLNIPESNNEIPDVLDETLWNVRWMLTMQDPEDGGVYNKTTNASFDGLTAKPDKATNTRYVVAKGTAATLDFCAVMAQVSRITSKFQTQLPGLSDSCLAASKKAWAWAQLNPNVAFNNPGAQSGYPAVSTGGYGDGDFGDELEWAASELYITTKDEKYYIEINVAGSVHDIPNWGSVRTLGLLSLAHHRKNLTSLADTTDFKDTLIYLANRLRDSQLASPYLVPDISFDWGSNSFVGNSGMILLDAFQFTGDSSYYNAALAGLDYLLGRNATTYSFVTGFGTKSTLHPHHRVSVSDTVAAPVPGWLAGGPQMGSNGDGCAYTNKTPATTYLDQQNCYTTNEIAINWNAPLVFLSNGLNALKSPDGISAVRNSQSREDLFMLSPNPSASVFNCTMKNLNGENAAIQIIDLKGNILKEFTTNNSQFSVGSDLQPGVYVMQVISKGLFTSKKMVKMQ